MEVREAEITVISARDLKNVSVFGKVKPYAVLTVHGALHQTKHKTPVDKENGTDPNWNHVITFDLEESALQQGRLVLEVVIHTDGTISDKEIGRVTVPLKDFLDKAGSSEFGSYDVHRSNGKAKGNINISVKLAEKPVTKQVMQPQAYAPPPMGYAPAGGSKDHATAYPAYPQGSSSYAQGYPPQGYPPAGGSKDHATAYPAYPQGSSSYAQGYPPQGYPPQGYPAAGGYPQGYYGGAPPMQKPPKKNKNMGMGLGAGLLGGALGGLLIGDMISDIGDDGGFDDGGFDF